MFVILFANSGKSTHSSAIINSSSKQWTWTLVRIIIRKLGKKLKRLRIVDFWRKGVWSAEVEGDLNGLNRDQNLRNVDISLNMACIKKV